MPRLPLEDQSTAIRTYLLGFESVRSITTAVATMAAGLTQDDDDACYEAALIDLGRFLGFDSRAVEKAMGFGPDIMWRTPGGVDYLLNLKTCRSGASALSHADQIQLRLAEQWHSSRYPGRLALRVAVLPEAVLEGGATSDGSFALCRAQVVRLAGAAQKTAQRFIDSVDELDEFHERCQRVIAIESLDPSGIRSKYLKLFEIAPKPA